MLRERHKLRATLGDPHVRPPRRLPVGAEVLRGGASIFGYGPHNAAMWKSCSKGTRAEPGAEPRVVALTPEASGYFSGLVAGADAGTLYRYRLDGEAALYPDPASRFQPRGPHGPSQVIDPAIFDWHDSLWPGMLSVRTGHL